MTAPLATRCPACSTVFRVVADQLRVSEGWVRCGRCSEVFNATESLVDLETGAQQDWGDEVLQSAPDLASDAGSPVAGMPDAPGDAEPGAVSSLPSEEPDAVPASLPPLQPGPPPLPTQAETTADHPADPLFDARADPPEVHAHRPSFVRRAERAERWRRPRVRAALVAAALLGVLGIAGQIAYEYRDLAAARFPQSRPVLEQACALLGCRVEAARAIDALTLESSGLVRVENSSLYKLSVALRNRAGIDVALPALDLALTDTQGRRIARRVLSAADLGATSPTLGAGRELTLQATLQATLPDAEPLAGYTIDLFYP